MAKAAERAAERAVERTVERTVELKRTVRFLPRATPEGYDRHWKLEVRAGRNDGGQRLARFVRKIRVQLHETFDPPTEHLTAAPFVVERDGYASFDMQLTLHFFDYPEPARIDYDMDVSAEGTHFTTHTLSFIDPSAAFLERLQPALASRSHSPSLGASSPSPAPSVASPTVATSSIAAAAAGGAWTEARRRELASRLAVLNNRSRAVDAVVAVVRAARSGRSGTAASDMVRSDAAKNAVTFDLARLDGQVLDDLERLCAAASR